MTISIENFIKAIYKQNILTGADTKLSTLAGLLKVTNAAATDMAKKLAGKELVYYTKYKPLSLTTKGKELALNVIRKHRLWESFLYQTLGLSLHEIHREAELLEHLTTDFLADKIDDYLGNPSTDPHGDPIPTLTGEMVNENSQLLLSQAQAGKDYEISRLYSSEKDFFDFCTSNHLVVGATIWVERQYVSNKMTEIIMDQNIILLNEEFTNVIFVKALE